MRYEVYNLQFPDHCPSVAVEGYTFSRQPDYGARVMLLHQTLTWTGEFPLTPRPGQHAATAYVDTPESEPKAILPWGGTAQHTALKDILLLLSMFTQRDVFINDRDFSPHDMTLYRDPRQYLGGSTLRASVPFQMHVTKVFAGTELGYDEGFEIGLGRIYGLMRSEEWLHEYSGGGFMFLALSVLRTDRLEQAFVQCWALWEHLFYLHNRAWLDDRTSRQVPAKDKIAFIVVKYGLADHVGDKGAIDQLVKTRDSIVHTGRLPPVRDRVPVVNEAVLFMTMTEFIVAKTLGLEPSDAINAKGRWKQYLETRQIPNSW